MQHPNLISAPHWQTDCLTGDFHSTAVDSFFRRPALPYIFLLIFALFDRLDAPLISDQILLHFRNWLSLYQ